jgi:hypothetical protein
MSVDTEDLDRNFEMIEEKYSRVDKRHHHMSDWLSKKIFSVLDVL